jgi:hypothetical protein
MHKRYFHTWIAHDHQTRYDLPGGWTGKWEGYLTEAHAVVYVLAADAPEEQFNKATSTFTSTFGSTCKRVMEGKPLLVRFHVNCFVTSFKITFIVFYFNFFIQAHMRLSVRSSRTSKTNKERGLLLTWPWRWG